MISISNKLLQDGSEQSRCFAEVQADAASQTTLSQRADVTEKDAINLPRQEMHSELL